MGHARVKMKEFLIQRRFILSSISASITWRHVLILLLIKTLMKPKVPQTMRKRFKNSLKLFYEN